ncbi:hypothetical protein QE408_004088 [Agrobacterium larrymoorei]|uniref:Uncharacterized protein n=1 Tax=Agrobacterium larrymoorei TaxID=160699 RepID=A0ABU0UPQ8_9HYPH|nr:hypothetical protein [Agrobacterium larrymoorei]
MTRRRGRRPVSEVGEAGNLTGSVKSSIGCLWISNSKDLSAVILGLDPRIHLFNGVRATDDGRTRVLAPATIRKTFNHP